MNKRQAKKNKRREVWFDFIGIRCTLTKLISYKQLRNNKRINKQLAKRTRLYTNGKILPLGQEAIDEVDFGGL